MSAVLPLDPAANAAAPRLPQARKARQQQGFSFGKWSASSCCSTWAF